MNIEDPEDRYGEALDVIVKLQDNVESSLRKLLSFKESWVNQEMLMNRLENWMTSVEKELNNLRDPSGGHIRQFWVSDKIKSLINLYKIQNIFILHQIFCSLTRN